MSTPTHPPLPNMVLWRESLRFPVASPDGRKEVLIGGLLLFFLPVGWVLNLGARLDVVQRLHIGERPYFQAFRPWRRTLRRGCIAALAIFCYLLPANLLFAFTAYQFTQTGSLATALLPFALGLAAFALAVFTLPGCMTAYACEQDAAVLRHPLRAFRRAIQHRGAYLKAWAIALVVIALSFAGLLFFVVGFFFTSVWAWAVVGYAFTVAMYSSEDRP